MIAGYARIFEHEPERILFGGMSCDQVYLERVEGSKSVRPMFNQMMRELKAGDTLVVESLSQMCRSIKDLLHQLQRLSDKGVRLLSQLESFDSHTEAGQQLLSTLEFVRRIENDIISNRTITGVEIARARPERLEHVRLYTGEIPEFEYRLNVKAGLTGYAQVYGKYNTSAYDKLQLDLMYIENYSIRLDIKLILMTLQVLLKKESTEGFDRVACEEVRESASERKAG